MYKDIISYELADGITEERLIEVGKQIVAEWMAKLDGFISWEINKDSAGNYTDIVSWQAEADAKKATDEMSNIPNVGDWYACYKEGSIKSQNLSQVAAF